MVDHLVFFAVKEEASPEEVEDLLSSMRGLKDEIPATVDLSVGEDFSGRSGEYTHGLFARFEDTAGLQEYMQHPAHLAVVEKLGNVTTGRIVADYEFQGLREPDYENVTPRELKARLDVGGCPVLLDVRERWEFELASIEGSKLVPMDELERRLFELDPAAETVVICHHGLRSAYVTQVLGRAGFSSVSNLEGGLDAYAEVDDSVPRY